MLHAKPSATTMSTAVTCRIQRRRTPFVWQGLLWTPPPGRPHSDKLKARTFQIAVRRPRRAVDRLAGARDNRREAELTRALESGSEQCLLGALPSLPRPRSCEAQRAD